MAEKNYALVQIPPENQIALVIRGIADGKTVRMMREEGLLTEHDNPFLWAVVDPRIAQQIETAQKVAGQVRADQIADTFDENLDPRDIKNKIDALKWYAEKYNPERFGKAPPPAQKTDINKMSKEQVLARKKELLAQLRHELTDEIGEEVDAHKATRTRK